jgi:lipopolysaccharide biosynthesis protein
MGINGTLPPFFNFPIGTMFWARPKALAPLFSLRLQWNDYPEEPVAIDGTVLHALERLLPFTAAHAGYRYATTHVPGITW